jgi:prepilin-type processing-associated H-X9-DG protein
VESQSNGVFAYPTSRKIAAITDGTSNTIAFSERLGGRQGLPDIVRGNGVNGVPESGGLWDAVDARINVPNLLRTLQACNLAWQANTNTSSAVQTSGLYWTWGASNFSLFNVIVPPNSTQYGWNSCRLDECGGPCGTDSSHFNNATSYHPGGCNVLFADGSVRFIKSSIDMNTWWSLGTIVGSEVVSSDSY